jgi:hypothetical protein
MIYFFCRLLKNIFRFKKEDYLILLFADDKDFYTEEDEGIPKNNHHNTIHQILLFFFHLFLIYILIGNFLIQMLLFHILMVFHK